MSVVQALELCRWHKETEALRRTKAEAAAVLRKRKRKRGSRNLGKHLGESCRNLFWLSSSETGSLTFD